MDSDNEAALEAGGTPETDRAGVINMSAVSSQHVPTAAPTAGRAIGIHFVPPEVDPEIVYEVRARNIIRALRFWRNERKLTVTETARRAEVDKSVISRFENDTTDPRLSTLFRYAEAVGLDLTIHVNGTDVSQFKPAPTTIPAQYFDASLLEGLPAPSGTWLSKFRLAPLPDVDSAKPQE